jgi:hypothetical protein
MANVLGLIGFAVFIAFTIALAAGVTWLVVRVSPLPKSGEPAEPSPPAGGSG